MVFGIIIRQQVDLMPNANALNPGLSGPTNRQKPAKIRYLREQ